MSESVCSPSDLSKLAPATWGRLVSRFVVFVTLALFGMLVSVPTALGAHATSCSRIQVETVDRGVTLNSYVVRDSEYVAKRRAEIEANGEDGAWTVSAGELGLVGYTVTYSCLP